MPPDAWLRVQRLVICTVEQFDLDEIQMHLPHAQIWSMSNPGFGFELSPITPYVEPCPNPDLGDLHHNYLHWIKLIQSLAFDAAIILTTPAQSPFSLAYLCYLAGIPIRVGQSCEFGGGVLSDCVQPLLEATSAQEHCSHLLQSVGLSVKGVRSRPLLEQV